MKFGLVIAMKSQEYAYKFYKVCINIHAMQFNLI